MPTRAKARTFDSERSRILSFRVPTEVWEWLEKEARGELNERGQPETVQGKAREIFFEAYKRARKRRK